MVIQVGHPDKALLPAVDHGFAISGSIRVLALCREYRRVRKGEPSETVNMLHILNCYDNAHEDLEAMITLMWFDAPAAEAFH